MSITNSIMAMFGGSAAPVAAAPNSQPTPPGNIPAGAAATGNTPTGAAPNGTIPPGAPAADPNATPLDAFSELWKNDPNAAAPGNTSVFGEVDPKKFMEAAGKVDFSKAIRPETLTAIQAGGEEGMKAFAAAMNSVAQNVYAQASFASTKITEQAMAKAREAFIAEIPQHIRSSTASESLRAENPIFSHPAAAPILGAVQNQLAVKFPQATAAELTAMAKTYLEQFATGISPPKVPAADPRKANETDWSNFLG
jgi:hypothetical protein